MATDTCQGHWLQRSRAGTWSRSSHTLLCCLLENKGFLPKDPVRLLHEEAVQKFGQRKYTRHTDRKAKANADTEGWIPQHIEYLSRAFSIPKTTEEMHCRTPQA